MHIIIEILFIQEMSFGVSVHDHALVQIETNVL
jgi:hypothetical protein